MLRVHANISNFVVKVLTFHDFVFRFHPNCCVHPSNFAKLRKKNTVLHVLPLIVTVETDSKIAFPNKPVALQSRSCVPVYPMSVGCVSFAFASEGSVCMTARLSYPWLCEIIVDFNTFHTPSCINVVDEGWTLFVYSFPLHLKRC